jgi:hypothetical protein
MGQAERSYAQTSSLTNACNPLRTTFLGRRSRRHDRPEVRSRADEPTERLASTTSGMSRVATSNSNSAAPKDVSIVSPVRSCSGAAPRLETLADARVFNPGAPGRPSGTNQNQGRNPCDRDEAKSQNGVGRSLTERSRRGVVRASCLLISFLGSTTLVTEISGASSGAVSATRSSNAADGILCKS